MDFNTRQHRPNRTVQDCEPTADSGLLNEQVLLLLFRSINWDPHVLCLISCVSRKLSAVAKRVLWKELCASRAPRMIPTLVDGEPNLRVDDGWQALAKVLFFCCGCSPSKNFQVERALPGHFSKTSRFSKTSGQSFLMKRCQNDLLYVSDPCEHMTRGGNVDDLGVFRGVFKGFMKSRTRTLLIRRQAALEQGIRCPYCGHGVWSMTSARLVPKTAAQRLGSHQENLEYFVCVNGHLHGSCLLVPLSSDDNNHDLDGFDDDSDAEVKTGARVGLVQNGASSSSGERIWDESMPLRVNNGGLIGLTSG